MRILFAIPHYFRHDPGGGYGSEHTLPETRAAATWQCLASLVETFSHAQGLLDGRGHRIHPANPQLAAAITIEVCTTRDDHLVPYLSAGVFEHIRTDAEPRHLGFECHKRLRDGLGSYDYFAYLEDDLRITDSLFFDKLAWFTGHFGLDAVLQPNRFELNGDPPYKLYIDGNPSDRSIGAGLQRADGEHRIGAPVFDRWTAFQRIENPHSACFFLTAAQLSRWVAEPDFAVPSAAFGGPLESAATLGLMRHFRTYKPARENAGFLEVEHLDRRYLGRHFHPQMGNPPSLPWK